MYTHRLLSALYPCVCSCGLVDFLVALFLGLWATYFLFRPFAHSYDPRCGYFRAFIVRLVGERSKEGQRAQRSGEKGPHQEDDALPPHERWGRESEEVQMLVLTVTMVATAPGCLL